MVFFQCLLPLPPPQPMRLTDRRLYKAVTQDPNHVLRKLLPEVRRVNYKLRPRVHGFQLRSAQGYMGSSSVLRTIETLLLASYTKANTNLCFDCLVGMFPLVF